MKTSGSFPIHSRIEYMYDMETLKDLLVAQGFHTYVSSYLVSLSFSFLHDDRINVSEYIVYEHKVHESMRTSDLFFVSKTSLILEKRDSLVWYSASPLFFGMASCTKGVTWPAGFAFPWSKEYQVLSPYFYNNCNNSSIFWTPWLAPLATEGNLRRYRWEKEMIAKYAKKR